MILQCPTYNIGPVALQTTLARANFSSGLLSVLASERSDSSSAAAPCMADLSGPADSRASACTAPQLSAYPPTLNKALLSFRYLQASNSPLVTYTLWASLCICLFMGHGHNLTSCVSHRLS